MINAVPVFEAKCVTENKSKSLMSKPVRFLKPGRFNDVQVLSKGFILKMEEEEVGGIPSFLRK